MCIQSIQKQRLNCVTLLNDEVVSSLDGHLRSSRQIWSLTRALLQTCNKN